MPPIFTKFTVSLTDSISTQLEEGIHFMPELHLKQKRLQASIVDNGGKDGLPDELSRSKAAKGRLISKLICWLPRTTLEDGDAIGSQN